MRINIKDPNANVKVVHSETKSAWNIVGTKTGGKFKIARVPYQTFDKEEDTNESMKEAFEHAKFIELCFNHSSIILSELSKL